MVRKPGRLTQIMMLTKKKILVIEDSRVCMALIKAFFRNTGTLLLMAESGKEGWSILMDHKVDLVITDLRLPDMDGIDLVRRIKKLDPDIPVLVQTGSIIDVTENDCREAGCNGYILKPYSRTSFLDTVQHLIRSGEYRLAVNNTHQA